MPIEGLRGLCAGLVVYAHVLAPATALDPRWAPPAFFWWLNLGYAAVLMLFVLSGYVIRLTTSGDASGPAVRRYLLLRFLRLVPMVTAAVLLAWCLVPSIEVRTVLGNLLFLQNSDPYPGGVTSDLMPNNPNLWSLNYEAVYYLAFIAVWRWQPRAGLVWTLLGIGMLASSAGWPALALLSHWACGGLYWLAGLALARRCAPTPGERRSHWPTALLGAYAMWTIAPLRSLLLATEWYPLFGGTPASPHRIDFLPGVRMGVGSRDGAGSPTAAPIGLWLPDVGNRLGRFPIFHRHAKRGGIRRSGRAHGRLAGASSGRQYSPARAAGPAGRRFVRRVCFRHSDPIRTGKALP